MGSTVTSTFRVKGMHCASCGMLIDDVVEDLPGVRRSQTTLRSAQAVVEYDPVQCTTDDVLGAIAEAGYEGVLIAH